MTDWEVIDRKRLDEKDREIQQLKQIISKERAENGRLLVELQSAYYEGWDDAKHSLRIDVDMAWDASDTKKVLDE